MRYPYCLLNKLTVFLLILTVTVFVILVKLGLWQLHRGEEKALLLAQMESRQALAPLTFKQLLQKIHLEDVTGYRLSITASPANAQIWLLDNQVYQGQVGYLAFQALEVEPEKPWLLVELGFIAATSSRDELPQIAPLSGKLSLVGKLYQKQTNPLSHALMAEAGTHIRIQNLNIPEITQLVGHPLVTAVLQPDQLPNLELAHPWQPFPLSAQKHWGYALQWFSMAAVFAGLMLWQGVKYVKHHHSANSMGK